MQLVASRVVWVAQAHKILERRHLPIPADQRIAEADLELAVVLATRLDLNMRSENPKVSLCLKIVNRDLVRQIDFYSTSSRDFIFTLHESGKMCCWDAADAECLASEETSEEAMSFKRYDMGYEALWITVALKQTEFVFLRLHRTLPYADAKSIYKVAASVPLTSARYCLVQTATTSNSQQSRRPNGRRTCGSSKTYIVIWIMLKTTSCST
jgi:hypothetical protein